MENNGMFRKSAFGGFNKRDVLGYIEELGAKAREQEAGMQKMQDEISELNRRLEDTRTENERLGNDLAAVITEKVSLKDTLAQLESGIARQQQIVQEKEDELRQRAESERRAQKKLSLYEQKSAKYDMISDKLGETLLKAQFDARTILEQAAREQAGINEQSKRMIDATDREIGRFVSDIDSLRKSIRDSFLAIDARLSSIASLVQATGKRLNSRRDAIEDAILPQCGQLALEGTEEGVPSAV